MSFRSGYGHKCAIEMYRDATLRQAKLAGVTIPTFMCRKCGKRQTVAGFAASAAPTENRSARITVGAAAAANPPSTVPTAPCRSGGSRERSRAEASAGCRRRTPDSRLPAFLQQPTLLRL
jgi:hypothetical protein